MMVGSSSQFMEYNFVYGTKKLINTFRGVLEQENGENVTEKVLIIKKIYKIHGLV